MTKQLAWTGLGLCAVVACTSSSTPTGPTPPSDVVVSAVSGDAQSGPSSAPLPTPVRIRATDHKGHPLRNFTISFVVTSGGGSVFAPAVTTDEAGYADELWTLGPRLGPQTLAARSVTSTGVAETYGTFTATGLPPNVPVVGSNSTGIILMNANGSNVKQVLTTGAQDYSPNLSPDRSQIVFFSSARVPDSTSVFVMNADGTNAHQVGPALYWSSGPPQWSPTGQFIVYAGQPSTVFRGVPAPANCCAPGIIVIDASGAIHSIQIFEEDEAGPAAWTANGQDVLFFCDDACFGSSGLFLENGDRQVLGCSGSSGPTACSYVNFNGPRAWDVGAVAASPDGQHIAFVGEPEGTRTSYLYTMNADGTNITQLTTALGLGAQLSYSPDGAIIAVDHGFINADGTDYQVVKGCPCSFAATPTTFSAAPPALFRARRHGQWHALRPVK